MKLLALQAVLLAALCCGITQADDVLVGSGDNFADLITNNAFAVVEFYAKWCGHCKNLEPEYAKAATQLKAHDPPIALVKVEATEELNKPLAEKYGVQGFPTIKIFREGDLENPQDYKGPRDADGIVSYLKKKTLPASSPLDSEDQVEAFTKDDPSVLGIFDTLSGPEFDSYLAVAGLLADDYSFAHSTVKSKIVKGETAPTVKIFKASEGKTATYGGKFQVDDLKQWIESNAIPLLIDLDENPKNREAVQKAFASSGPRFFSIFDKGSKADTDLRPALNKLAETLIGEAFFINVDPSNQHALDYFGVKMEDTPAFVIQSGKSKYVASNVVGKKLQSFWNDFKAGSLKQAIKSEELPAKNDGPVTIVTGNTLEEVVFSHKNTLIYFYAPWCGHCKKLAPVWDEVGKHFAKDSSVVIAKMDATANDVTVEQFEVSGFPTIYFISSTGEVSLYSGDRSEENLISFVETKSVISEDAKKTVDDHSEL